MRVIYISQHFGRPEGAGSLRVYHFTRRLVEAGHDVVVVAGPPFDEGGRAEHRVAEESVDGVRIVRVGESYSKMMSIPRRLLAFGAFAAKATKLVRRMDADLVFATSTPLTAGIPGALGARKLGVPFVFEVRDLWPAFAVEMGIVRNRTVIAAAELLERRLYRSAAQMIALAPGIKDGICATGYDPQRVSMIPNACDLDIFVPSDAPLRDSRFGEESDLRLIFAGSHGVANGLDAVLDAAVVLKQRREKGIRFVFIGRGPERERLMSRSSGEGLDESLISWIDPMPKMELAAVMPRFDVGLMILANFPGFYRSTSPNKFFDYIASGLPVLNNYPGWLADEITSNECGTVVPPDDPVAFADAVLWMRDNRHELRPMAQRSRLLAEEKYSRGELGTAFVRVLEQAGAYARP